MKKVGYFCLVDLVCVVDLMMVIISNWFNDYVSFVYVKVEQLFCIVDVVKLDVCELLYGVSGFGVGEWGNIYIFSQVYLDVWQDVYELVSYLVEEKGLEIDYCCYVVLDLLVFELLMDGFSCNKVIWVLMILMM